MSPGGFHSLDVDVLVAVGSLNLQVPIDVVDVNCQN